MALALCPPLERFIHNHWKGLTPIQEIAFTPVSEGKNVLLMAQTAGGKTHAAFLPLLNRHYARMSPAGVKILYIAPLKALINNMEDRFLSEGMLDELGWSIFKWHGDVNRSKRLVASRNFPDILLTTPESVDVILCSNYVDKTTFFAPLDAVIIDEAHYFAGIERGAQLVSVLNRLEMILDRDLQRICLSATVGNPEEVLEWLAGPSFHRSEVLRADSEKPQRVVKIFYFDTETDENDTLTSSILHPPSLIEAEIIDKRIIFEPSRTRAERRSKDFHGSAVVCHVHHSSVDRFWREKAELDLVQAKGAMVVIATCTLELGIDVGDLDLVQQESDFPSVSSYLQRIGRTGRRKPPQGSYAYVCDEFDFLKNIAIMSLGDKGAVERNSLPTNFYNVLLQQLLMLVLSGYGYPEDRAFDVLKRCRALSSISKAEYRELLEHWITEDILRKDDGLLLIGPVIEKRFSPTNFKDLYVLFEGGQSLEVWHQKAAIGTLDRLFLLGKHENFAFILAGKWWQVESVDFEDGRVYVKPFLQAPPPATWITPRGHQVSYPIAQEIKRILLSDDESPYIDQGEAKRLLRSLRQKARSDGLNSDAVQVITIKPGDSLVTNYAGDRTNLLLAEFALRRRGWQCDDITYAGFRVRKTDVNKEPHELFVHFIRELIQTEAFDDQQLLAVLCERYCDETTSKWWDWIPVKYRSRFFASEIFDPDSARDWCKKIM
ncbi:DEAD/DEAH box helicase [bacterium]|nr:DEAD/DEAH box helicase [bacterium]